MATQATATADEDRILRRWTPLILRAILIVSTVIMVAGIALSMAFAPDYYVGRFDAIRLGRLFGRESMSQLVHGMRQGQPHAVMIIGLYILDAGAARPRRLYAGTVSQGARFYLCGSDGLRAGGVDHGRDARAGRVARAKPNHAAYTTCISISSPLRPQNQSRYG